MYMAAHSKKDYFKELRKNGIEGELSKLKVPYLTGWYNNIAHFGGYHVHSNGANDVEKALEIFTDCGFNDCKIKGRYIEIKHDSKK